VAPARFLRRERYIRKKEGIPFRRFPAITGGAEKGKRIDLKKKSGKLSHVTGSLQRPMDAGKERVSKIRGEQA